MSRVSLIAVAFISATEGAASPKFETEIQPIFEKHCTSCHGPEKQKSGLRLDSRKSALAGGESNKPAIVPMKTGESRLVELISAAPGSDLRMPPKGEMLKPEQVSLIKAWIEAGAEWPEAVKPVGNIRREMVVTDKDREHWAFRCDICPALHRNHSHT